MSADLLSHYPNPHTFFLVGPRAGTAFVAIGRVFQDGQWTAPRTLQAGELGQIQRIFRDYYSAYIRDEAFVHGAIHFKPGGCYYVHNETSGDSDLRSDGFEPAEAPAEDRGPDGHSNLDYAVSSDADRDGQTGSDAGATLAGPSSVDDDFLSLEPPATTQMPAGPATGSLSLNDALDRLDPENAAHWTSAGAPSLDYLSVLTGTKVSRSAVLAARQMFNRQTARQARAE